MKYKISSLPNQETNSHHHQPILLTRSDAFQPYQQISSSPITTAAATATATATATAIAIATDTDTDTTTITPRENDTENGNNLTQDKRKWDQVVDDSSKTNTAKALMHEHPSQLLATATIEDDEESQDSDDPHATLNVKRLGRKPMADEDPSDDGDPKVKRKAQNRAAQRAFRDRKERYVKDLEIKLKQVQDTHVMATNHLYQENHQLRSIIYRLETENVALKGIHIQHGPLSGKPIEQWMEALQGHQQQFPNVPLSLIPSPQTSLPMSSLTNVGSLYSQQSQGVSLSNLAPTPVNPNSTSLSYLATTSNYVQPTSSSPPSTSTLATTEKPRQQQNNVQYTFSISTPATLRSRHKQQQQQQQQQQQENRSSPSPSTTSSKQQPSPVELVRLYPHEHSTMATSTSSSMVPALLTVSSPVASGATNAYPPPQSPASSVSASTHGSLSAAQTPTIECQAFCEKLQEEVCTNAFDQLLSEPLFDITTAAGLNTSLCFPHLDEDHPLAFHHQELDHHTPSSLANDYDPSSSIAIEQQHSSTSFLSGQEIYDRLHQHPRFEQYSSSQLLSMIKSMAKCTHLGPVITEQDIKFVLTKMDQGRV